MVFGLPCWVFFTRHDWSPWYASVADGHRAVRFKICAGCGARRWNMPPTVSKAHPTTLPGSALMDDGRTWAEHLASRTAAR